MRASVPRVHAVMNDRVATRRDLVERGTAIAAGGGTALHVRSRMTSARALLGLARTFRGSGAVVFVNDRADVARLAGAGVHLPAGGLPIPVARELLGADALVGCSAHSPAAARRAADEGADYVFLGPIWRTPSHPEREPLGTAAIRAAGPARVIAIGGITVARVAACRDAGAYGVAAIRAIWDDPDPGSVVRRMLVSLESAERENAEPDLER